MKYEIEFYKIDVENSQFVFLGSTTSYKSLTFANRLNDIGAASFSLNLLDPTCNTRLIKRFTNQVVIKKGNSVQFVGPIIDYSGTYDDNGGYLDVFCASYLYHLTTRYTAALKTYTATEQSTIAWDLIDTVQSRTNGYLGIEEGTLTTTGVTRDRTYEYFKVAGALINLSNVLQGLDFNFTATLDGDNKLESIKFNTFYPLGSLRTNLPPLTVGENIKLKTFKSRTRLHNSIIGVGAGLVDPITSTEESVAFQKAFTRREYILDEPDVSVQGTLDDKVKFYLNEESSDKLSIMIRLYQDKVPTLGQVFCGDSLKLNVQKGAFLAINRDYRITGIEVTIDNNDAETITLLFD
jgi:hypothetical protein